MDTQETLQIIELLLAEKLPLRKAVEYFGSIQSRSATQVRVRAKDNRFEYVILETPVAAPDVVISVAIRMVEPASFDVAFFEKMYGKPRVLPRLKPDQPVPEAFDVTFRRQKGQLLLGLRDEKLVTIKVDRFD